MMQERQIDMEDMAFTLLENIEAVLIKKYGKEYTTKLTKSSDGHTLCSGDFVLTFSLDNMHFYISYKIGLFGRTVAQLTKDIMNVLTSDEFTVLEDSYYDSETESLVFGTDALYSKQRDMITESGNAKCPICEKIYKKSNIHENGICKFCDIKAVLWN